MAIEDKKAFEDALAAKLAGPEQEPPAEPASEPPEPAVEADTSPPPEPAPEGDEPAAEGDAEPAADDELQKLRRQLEDKDQFIGRMSNDLGELRQQVAALQPAARAPDQQTVEWVDEAAQQNPYGTAEWVRQNQPALYERVMETWYENDPRSAGRYETELRIQAERQVWQQAQQPIQEQYGQARLQQAWQSVSARHPDMNDLAQAMAEVTERAPELLLALQAPGSEERALENLYLLAKATRPDPAPHQAAAPAPAQSAPGAAVRLADDAYVASATSAQPTATAQQDWEAQFKEQFRQASAQRISITEELNKNRAA